VVVLLVGLAYVGVTLARHGGDPLAFALVGTQYSQGDPQGTQGYDGQMAWMRDPNGQTIELAGYELQAIMNSLYFISGKYLDKESENQPMLIGDTIANDSHFYIYKAHPPGGDSLSLYINSQSGQIEMILSYIDEISMLSMLKLAS